MKKSIVVILALVAACQAMPDNTAVEGKKEALKRVAEAAKQSGNVTVAAELETQILGLDAADEDSFVALADSLKKLGNNKDALDILKTGAEANPESKVLQFELAKAYIENSEPKPAIEILEKIQITRGKDFYNALGIAYDMDNQYDKAQKAFDDGLKLATSDGLLLNNKALSMVLNGHAKEGAKIFEELVKRPDAKPKYKFNLALAYAFSEDDKKASQILFEELEKEQASEDLEYYKKLRKFIK